MRFPLVVFQLESLAVQICIFNLMIFAYICLISYAYYLLYFEFGIPNIGEN